MDGANLIVPWLVLVFFCLALSVGAAMGCLKNRREAVGRSGVTYRTDPPAAVSGASGYLVDTELKRPMCWLAIKGKNLMSVKAALGVSNAKPCPVADAWRTEQRIFIAPPVRGWILVVGSDLPEPAEDVDACFRFIVETSRKLGSVQYFSFNEILQHHGWVRAEKGRVVRAYVWAGRTLWKQGKRTAAERELDLTCHDYLIEPELFQSAERDAMMMNTEKVPLLASRWSIDPGSIGPGAYLAERGIVGEGIPRY